MSDEEISTILEYQALLPILQSDENDLKVNARDLHKQLNSGLQFTDWIENRIKSYHLIKDVDYITNSRKYEIDVFTESKDILDYILTLDCAKQLAMVENNKIEVFLSCRKQIDRDGIKRMEEESMSVDLLK